MLKEDKFDVAVIGAGPAGMMAAGIATEFGAKVILIEKNKQLGKKLLLTGNGRCNITNAEFNLRDLVRNYNNGEFLFHAFSVFGPKETINFFNKLGVKTKIENNKKVFPISEESEEVLEALSKYLADKKVNIVFDAEVIDIECKNNKISKLILKDKSIKANNYIFCTGGKSYPSTGSNGAGYKLSEKLGHTIERPRPALCPVILKEEWVKGLRGIGLKDTKINGEDGEIIFTHFGISGPAVLNISGNIGDLLEKGETKISVDFLRDFEAVFKKYPNKTIKNILSIIIPERMAEVLVNIVGIDKNKIANNMSKIERGAIAKILKNFEMTAEDISGFKQAMVTRGGISLKEIDHKTMKSKIIDNLFFAGEIIDVDGKTGGFNLQVCWSTGYLAGKNYI